MSAVIEFLSQNMGVIGLILISPALYRLVFGFTLWLLVNFKDNKKDIVIKHFHNGKLISETTIKADVNEPLFIKQQREE